LSMTRSVGLISPRSIAPRSCDEGRLACRERLATALYARAGSGRRDRGCGGAAPGRRWSPWWKMLLMSL
jgi:hypothetical protein